MPVLNEAMSLTCFAINIKVSPLRLCNVEWKLPLRGRVSIRGSHQDDGGDGFHVLRDRREVDGLGKLRSVVVDVQHIHINMRPGGPGLSTKVGGHNGEPVVGNFFSIQRPSGPDRPCGDNARYQQYIRIEGWVCLHQESLQCYQEQVR